MHNNKCKNVTRHIKNVKPSSLPLRVCFNHYGCVVIQEAKIVAATVKRQKTLCLDLCIIQGLLCTTPGVEGNILNRKHPTGHSSVNGGPWIHATCQSAYGITFLFHSQSGFVIRFPWESTLLMAPHDKSLLN